MMTTEYLYQQEVDRVLAALMPQNQLIVRVMLQTGMRLSDVLTMRTEALSMSGWYRESKTGKKRRYGLPRPLYEAIREQAGPEWAFPGRYTGSHKTRQAVWKDIKRASKAFRLPQNVGAHSFRKVYAVKLLRKYGSIEKVQKNLNHASSSVTAIYAMADILLDRKKRETKKKREKRQKIDPVFAFGLGMYKDGKPRQSAPKGSSEGGDPRADREQSDRLARGPRTA